MLRVAKTATSVFTLNLELTNIT